MNSVALTMNGPLPGRAYSCKEQRVIVSNETHRSWNGITEFAGGSSYDTSTDKHSYVCARLTLALQMRATRLRLEQSESSKIGHYLIALIATSGHGYNFVEASVDETHAGDETHTSDETHASDETQSGDETHAGKNSSGRVLEWRRLSELEVNRRRGELLNGLCVPLDSPNDGEISRRWRDMDLPQGDENILGTRIAWR